MSHNTGRKIRGCTVQNKTGNKKLNLSILTVSYDTAYRFFTYNKLEMESFFEDKVNLIQDLFSSQEGGLLSSPKGASCFGPFSPTANDSGSLWQGTGGCKSFQHTRRLRISRGQQSDL